MSAPGSPKREHRSAQHEGFVTRAPGRPKREHRSAQHEGFVTRAPGRPKREHRSAQHEGFTLLELMVALAILGLLSLLGYRAVAALAESEIRLSAETTRWRTLDQFFMRLEADVREALPRASRVGETVEPAWVGSVDMNGNAELRFARAGPEFNVETGAAGQRIGYRLRDGAIEVLYWPYLDVAAGTVPRTYALAEGVAQFRVDYLDRNGAWQRLWPLSGDGELPRAVRVALTLADGAAVERWMVLR